MTRIEKVPILPETLNNIDLKEKSMKTDLNVINDTLRRALMKLLDRYFQNKDVSCSFANVQSFWVCSFVKNFLEASALCFPIVQTRAWVGMLHDDCGSSFDIAEEADHLLKMIKFNRLISSA